MSVHKLAELDFKVPAHLFDLALGIHVQLLRNLLDKGTLLFETMHCFFYFGKHRRLDHLQLGLVEHFEFCDLWLE
jgi:hypothetical protein